MIYAFLWVIGSASFINRCQRIPSFLLARIIYDRAAAVFCSIPHELLWKNRDDGKLNNRRCREQDVQDESSWNEMVTVNGIEKKRSRIRSVFKKNAEIHRVIGCSQLTGGNDDDEYDSIAYYACSFRERFLFSHFLKPDNWLIVAMSQQ